MNESEFRQLAAAQGYREVDFKDYPADLDGPLHTHDFSVMLWVVQGVFSLACEDGVRAYRPGESCELAAGVPHAERTGAGGARVLLGKRTA
ncbi:MAG TPA: AraC family transcriptional regulator [Hydrogenophaga sp.]